MCDARSRSEYCLRARYRQIFLGSNVGLGHDAQDGEMFPVSFKPHAQRMKLEDSAIGWTG